MQVMIDFPDTLAHHFQAQINAGPYRTLSDYLQHLVQQDQDRKAQLETRLLEALDSPASPLTQDDWDEIRAAVRQNLSQGKPNA
jgi:Arc/MetJ-type ribon-helix-helix transcriptional regulator